jgi:hypothetical protein
MSEPLPAPVFNASYNVPLTNIGEGYAAGISQAGKSIAEAIGSVSDIAKQNVDTNDTLAALKQTGILKDCRRVEVLLISQLNTQNSSIRSTLLNQAMVPQPV